MSPSRSSSPGPALQKDMSDEAIASDWSASPTGPYTPTLSYITEGASVIDVDPTSCIPLFLGRKLCENAVLRLMAVLNGDTNDEQVEFGLTGMVSGTPTSVVVPLLGSLSQFLDDYLEKTYESPEDRESVKGNNEIWYGVIDGNQLLCALLRLRVQESEKWGSVKWKVFCVRSDLCLSDYRKLAFIQNERNKQKYHYETTLYELLNSLRTIHDNIYKERVKVSRTGSRGVSIHHRDVAHLHDGGDHERNTTVRQAVTVATRLSKDTIETIGEIMNMSCPDVILASGDLNTHKLKSASSVLAHYDCRLFKNFLCTSTLRGARNFMNAVKNGEKEAQTNTVHRARHWCERNSYRPLRPSVLNNLFRSAKLALFDEQKFLEFIGEDSWPKHMETTKENLLRTTSFDDELDSNQGNSTDVLPVLWECFKRLYPGRAKGIENENSEKSDPNDSESGDTAGATNGDADEPPQSPDLETNNQSEEERRKLEEEEAKKKESDRQAKMRVTADNYLVDSGIRTCPMSFDEFIRDVWTTSSSRFDLVLSSVPSCTEGSKVLEKLPLFCQTVLKTGSYVFLIVCESDYWPLHEAFKSNGFKVCDHVFNIIYDTSTMRRLKSHDFPQKHTDIALVAKTQGQHPSGFKPDFTNKRFGATGEGEQSGFASFINMETCSNKLKRPSQNSSIFPNEKSVQLFSRVIQLFTGAEGCVIDPFAGPLTTSLACLQTDRRCTSIGSSTEEAEYAHGRLRIFATPGATMEQLDVYTDLNAASCEKDDNGGESHLESGSVQKKRKQSSTRSTAGSSSLAADTAHLAGDGDEEETTGIAQTEGQSSLMKNGTSDAQPSNEIDTDERTLDGATALLSFQSSDEKEK